MTLTRNKLRKKKKHPVRKFVLLLILLILAAGGIQTGANKLWKKDYSALSEKNRQLFTALNALAQGEEEDPVWEELSWKPLVLVQEAEELTFFGKLHLRLPVAYAIGTNGLGANWYAKRITMPEGYSLPPVYRLSVYTPELLATWIPRQNYAGSFRIAGLGEYENIPVVYYGASDIGSTNPEVEIAGYLLGESYRRDLLGDRIAYKSKPEEAEEAASLSPMNEEKADAAKREIQEALFGLTELLQREATEDEWHIAIQKYLDACGRYRKADPASFEKDIRNETLEGTLAYVTLKAYGLAESVDPLERIVEVSEEGEMAIHFTTAKKGCLLCMVLEERGAKNWQQRLNADPALMLYEILLETNAEG